MTAVPDDGPPTPEEGAEDAARTVYLRYVTRRTIAIVAAIAGGAVFAVADVLFAVLALKYVPPWAVGFIVCFLIANLAHELTLGRRFRLERKLRRKALATEDGAVVFLDAMQRAKDQIVARSTLRLRVRTLKFWVAVGIRAVFTACAAVVLTAWLGVALGLVVAAVYTVAGIAFEQYSTRRVALGWVNAFLFADPRPPRDSPEM